MQKLTKQKAADIASVKKIFASYNKAFTFEQIKAIFLILVKYWEPSKQHCSPQLFNWTKMEGYKKNYFYLQVNNIYISNSEYYSHEYNDRIFNEIENFINS